MRRRTQTFALGVALSLLASRASAQPFDVRSPEAIARLARSLAHAPPERQLTLVRAMAAQVHTPVVREAFLRLLGYRAPKTRPAKALAEADTIDSDETGSSDSDADGTDSSATEESPRPYESDKAFQELARETAAIALACTGALSVVEPLFQLAVAHGPSQGAAWLSLVRCRPATPHIFSLAGASQSPTTVRLLGALEDLRAIEPLRVAATSSDPARRAPAIVGLAALGDHRTVDLARRAWKDANVDVREAGAKALVLLGVKERAEVVASLLDDPTTLRLGLSLAREVHHPTITDRLVREATKEGPRALRELAIGALGRTPDARASSALASLVAKSPFGYEAALALARSPSPSAGAEIARGLRGPYRTTFARARLVRASLRHERDADADAQLFAWRTSSLPVERALAAFAQVALGPSTSKDAFADPDPRIRRAAIMAMAATPRASDDATLLEKVARDPDPLVRAIALPYVPASAVSTNELLARAATGGPDALLSVERVSERASADLTEIVRRWLGSPDASLRAAAARGLGHAAYPRAMGWLATAFDIEADPRARYAIVRALAQHPRDAGGSTRRSVLTMARVDPDPRIEHVAQACVASDFPVVTLGYMGHEVAWIRLVAPDGTKPAQTFAGTILTADGGARPIAFDDEGQAIVAGLPAGPYRLVLASAAGSYDPSPR